MEHAVVVAADVVENVEPRPRGLCSRSTSFAGCGTVLALRDSRTAERSVLHWKTAAGPMHSAATFNFADERTHLERLGSSA